MGVKNNLRQLFLATPTSALTTFEKEGYVRHKNNLRQHVFMGSIINVGATHIRVVANILFLQ